MMKRLKKPCYIKCLRSPLVRSAVMNNTVSVLLSDMKCVHLFRNNTKISLIGCIDFTG